MRTIVVRTPDATVRLQGERWVHATTGQGDQVLEIWTDEGDVTGEFRADSVTGVYYEDSDE